VVYPKNTAVGRSPSYSPLYCFYSFRIPVMIAQTLASLISKKMLFSTSPVFHAESVKVLPVLKTTKLLRFKKELVLANSIFAT
ncbi:MAG TPA: hypothetical protein VJ919_13220, partial [Tangfeifania sp.]|nr:hypothetical protein [Tangfeifania sp.]